nr:hypothetical protein [Tanacetum cinerariifolium]
MQSLATDGRDLALGHHVERDDVRQTPALHVLHDNPKIAADQETIHKVDNVLVLAVLHDQDFVDDEVLLRLLLQVHLLDGHAFIRAHFECRVHT